MAMEDIGIRFLVIGLGEARRSVGTMRDDMRGLESTIRSVSGTALDWGATINKIGGALVGVGRTMSLAITTPLAIIGGALVNSGAQFEDTFAGVLKTVGGLQVGFNEIASAAKSQLGITVETMDEARKAAQDMGIAFGSITPLGLEVRDAFRDIALQIPVATSELNRIGELAGTFGVPASEVAKFTKLVAEMGATTDISTEVAVSGLAKLFNIVTDKTPTMTQFVEKAGSAIVALGNTSVATQGDILNLAMRIASAGDRAKFSTPEILAWATVIGDVGARAEAGGTAVSRALNEMIIAVQTGGDNLKTFAAVTGESVDQFTKEFETNASNALLKFIKKLNEGIAAGKISKDMLNDMGLGGIRAIDILGRLANAEEDFTKQINTANDAYAQGVALQDVAEKRFQTVASQVQILKNTFTDLGITLFDLVKGNIKEFIDGIVRVITWFKNLQPEAQKVIVKIALIAAAIGPLLIIAGGLIQVLGTLVTIIGALTSPVGLVVAAVAGLVLVLGSMIGWDKIIDGINTAFANLETPVKNISLLIDDLVTKKASLQDIWNAMKNIALGPQPAAPALTNNAAGAQDFTHPATTTTGANGAEIQTQIAGMNIPPELVASVQSAIDWFKQLGGVVDFVGKIIDAFVKTIVSVVWPQLQSAFDSLTQILGSMGITWGDVWEALKQAVIIVAYIIGGIIAVIIGAVAGLASATAGFIKGVIETWQSMEAPISSVILGVQEIVTNFINGVQALFRGDFKSAFAFAEGVVKGWADLFGGLFGVIVAGFSGFVTTVFSTLKGFVDGVSTFFTNLYNNLVGHSIVWDIVDGILGAFESMKSGALSLLTDLASGAASLLSGIFGGGGNQNGGGFSLFAIGPDQLTAIQGIVTQIQTMFTTMLATVTQQFSDFMLGLQTSMINLPAAFQTAIDAIGASFGSLAITVSSQLANLQLVAISAFMNMGVAASGAFASGVVIAMTGTIAFMIGQMNYLDTYWYDTTQHMVGHWQNFVAQTQELTAEWTKNTIASFDMVHNQGVGKIHEIRDAWRADIPQMIGDTGKLTASLAGAVGAFGMLGGAAASAAGAVWAAAHAMIAALQAVHAEAQGSPKLKLQHSFEAFEKYLDATDFGVKMGAQMAIPSFMSQITPSLPAQMVEGGGTTINRNVTTGDINGANLSSADEVTDTMLRVIRMSEALSG